MKIGFTGFVSNDFLPSSMFRCSMRSSIVSWIFMTRFFQIVPCTLLRMIFQETGVQKMGWFEKATFLWGEIHSLKWPESLEGDPLTTNSEFPMLLHWCYPNVEIPSWWMSDVSVKRKGISTSHSSSNFPLNFAVKMQGFILFCRQLRLRWLQIFHGWSTEPSLTDDMIAIWMLCYPGNAPTTKKLHLIYGTCNTLL